MTSIRQRRRQLFWLCSATCLAYNGIGAQAESLAPAPAPVEKYPIRPITLVVPQTPGGTNDIVGRVIAQKLSDITAMSVIVENRPGAGGNIGTQAVARSAKDGYTLLLTVSSAQAINPALYKNPGFDPIKDFTPVL